MNEVVKGLVAEHDVDARIGQRNLRAVGPMQLDGVAQRPACCVACASDSSWQSTPMILPGANASLSSRNDLPWPQPASRSTGAAGSGAARSRFRSAIATLST